eukprot:TRINITY_DN5609_c0_g1_i1.p1 TRINITY_DN5609_c0_g1~~TRINITY_DN5609_c0_g1_i1.p1  ORF type:complete len:360 (-),score=60.08 TRINITY_DN5609_c0_g1_i1:38-1117(-)
MATCETPGCGKPAKLQCPTCNKMQLMPSSFCSQECFKSFWVLHKAKHVIVDPFAGYTFTGPLRPARVTPMRSVPAHIPRPEYADTGKPVIEDRARGNAVVPYNQQEIEILREVAKIGRDALDIAGAKACVGMTTEELDIIVHEAIIERNAYPSPLNYRGFPKSCCTSINEVICHGIPDQRPLEAGDILNVDVSVYYKGMHIDLNETFFIEDETKKVDDATKKLVHNAYMCLERAIAMCKPGTMYRDLGDTIQYVATKEGFDVVRSYCGHGTGRFFHCTPNIPHYKNNKAIGVMKPGHVFTIEPMINAGSWHDRLWPDDWTVVTKDGKKSAQFEHTLLITDTGVEVLTRRTKGSYVDRFV